MIAKFSMNAYTLYYIIQYTYMEALVILCQDLFTGNNQIPSSQMTAVAGGTQAYLLWFGTALRGVPTGGCPPRDTLPAILVTAQHSIKSWFKYLMLEILF